MSIWQSNHRDRHPDFSAWLHLPATRRAHHVTDHDLRYAQQAQFRTSGAMSDEPLAAVMEFTTDFHRITAPPGQRLEEAQRQELLRRCNILNYMLAHWPQAGTVVARRGAAPISSMRDEAMRRLRAYYVGQMSVEQRTVFDGWVDSRSQWAEAHRDASVDSQVAGGGSWQSESVRDAFAAMQGFRNEV
jgi:hypothetical protein